MRVAILIVLSAGLLTGAPGNAAPLPFPLPPVMLTVAVAQGAGSVTSAPAGIDCGATCSAQFAWGTPVQLTATPSAGLIVTGWSGPCAATTSPTCTFVLSANMSVAVSFGKPTLTVVVQDKTPLPTPRGWVTSNGIGSQPGIDCGPSCSASFDAGTVVTLWAIPFTGSIFEGWTGACTDVVPCVVTMDQARSVTAVFDFPWSPTDIKSNFTVSRTGSGSGTVKSGPPGISCGSDCSMRYPSNINITLTATPADGSHVAGWSGPCAGVGTGATCIVTVGPANGVTVTFDLNRSAPTPAPAPVEPTPVQPAPVQPAKPQDPPKPQEPAQPAVGTITNGPATLRVVRAARRVMQLELTLRTDANCRLRLLRRGSAILTRNVKARAGRNTLTLPASRRLPKGHYRLEVVLTDGAGRVQRLTWPVRL
jgi:Divergent InlB B-repeat domain